MKATFRKIAAMMIVLMSVTMTDAQEVYKLDESATVQLLTNGVYDLLLCPNIGVEIQTDLGVAWQLDYIGAWWNNDSRHRFFSNYIFQTELRYYLSQPRMNMPYTGHHAGLYGLMATYDFEFGGKGYQSKDLDFSFGVGFSYGYVLPVSKKLSIDFTVGLGYLHSRYDIYQPSNEGTYKKLEERHLNLFGPTKLEVSLVWNINAINIKKQ